MPANRDVTPYIAGSLQQPKALPGRVHGFISSAFSPRRGDSDDAARSQSWPSSFSPSSLPEKPLSEEMTEIAAGKAEARALAISRGHAVTLNDLWS
jgi:hypothetical protein